MLLSDIEVINILGILPNQRNEMIIYRDLRDSDHSSLHVYSAVQIKKKQK